MHNYRYIGTGANSDVAGIDFIPVMLEVFQTAYYYIEHIYSIGGGSNFILWGHVIFSYAYTCKHSLGKKPTV